VKPLISWALLALPFIIVAHRFSANMGYRYMATAAALRDALHVGIIVLVLEIGAVGIHLLMRHP
jgi:hypothetical protein